MSACRCCHTNPKRQRSDVCRECAHALNVENTAARREFERRPPCPGCAAMLPGFDGASTRCHPCQQLYDQMMRAAEARVARGYRASQEGERIERQLAALAAARKRRRLTLADEDCWAWASCLASCAGMGADL